MGSGARGCLVGNGIWCIEKELVVIVDGHFQSKDDTFQGRVGLIEG